MHDPLTIHPILQHAEHVGAADIYLTVGLPPIIRLAQGMHPFPNTPPLHPEDVEALIRALLTSRQLAEFAQQHEINAAIATEDGLRFRLSAFHQQQHWGAVLRRVRTVIPTFAELGLPPVYAESALIKRGLVIIAGQTGSGKTTSLAAMLNHRNQHSYGHILTVEDPIEYVIPHGRCVVTQREVGIDTHSFGAALKQGLRQSPDVVAIGEIRDTESMVQALRFAETGHLCLATLHAGNACQALERIAHFFSIESHGQIFHTLATMLRCIMTQRLAAGKKGGHALAVEVLRNQGYVTQLIRDGNISQIPEMLLKNTDQGTQTFDQALLKLYHEGAISYDTLLAEADQPENLKVQLRLATPQRD